MAIEQLIALMGFVVVMTGTPGPNNMMLLASGANFGFRRSIPQILGINIGCQSLLMAIALGLGQLLIRFPVLELVLKVLCGGALLYLTWGLVKPALFKSAMVVQGAADQQTVVSKPLTLWLAAVFQWVNPKAWMMMLTAIATYTQAQTLWRDTLLIGLLFAVLGMPVNSMWNLFGATLRAFLQDPLKARVFNLVMGVLLLGSMYPLFQ
jgi:threonine/homoserine/homoserine lactone efflux protein